MNEERKKEVYEDFQKTNPDLFDREKFQHETTHSKLTLPKVKDKKFIEMLASRRRRPDTPEQIARAKQHLEAVRNFPKRIAYVDPKKNSEPKMTFRYAKYYVNEILEEIQEAKKFEYDFDEFNIDLFRKLTKYFSQQPVTKEEIAAGAALDPKKGLWLFGQVGVGKTLIAEVFEQFTQRHDLPTAFQLCNLKRISRQCQMSGISALDKYYQQRWCFDDVGFEEKVKHMGNLVCPFSEMVNEIYQRHTRNGKVAFVTTNLGMDSIASNYGDRIADRCKQLFTPVFLDGKSRRK